ncbi:MAG: TetR/AcrR family transcriptional regulator [Coriobacteriales bacterium]|jgi:AcrR family transcriptional regulator
MQKRKTQTEAKLADAFWQLYATHPIERISIRMLTETAGVHRSSFYHHYEDIYDLRRVLEQQLVSEAKQTVLTASSDETWFEVASVVTRFYRASLKKMTVLLGPKGDPGFFPMLREEMTPVFLAGMSIPADDKEARYVVEFLLSGIVSFMTSWYLNEEGEPPTEMLGTIRSALLNGCQAELSKRSTDPVKVERFLEGRE